ncbi:MAG: ketopantoate reductase family protein [Promethearchaeota archaeon]
MSRKKLRVGIIGAGSIGSLFGGYLATIESDVYEIEVIFFGLKEHIDAVNQFGLKIYKDQDVKETNNIKAYENEKELEDKIKRDSSFRFDFIFLTTKTYDIEKAVLQYKKLIDISKRLVILQNGIGNEDVVRAYVSKTKIIRAVTTNGALLKEPGHLYHTGLGITKIGFPFLAEINLQPNESEEINADLSLLKEILESVGFKTIITDEIIKETWEKVFVNIGINAFGALTNLKNGELLKVEGLKNLMNEAIKEAVKVAQKKKINLSMKDYSALTFEVAKKTAENKNSMLQDIINGNPTEIDFINGRVVVYANELNIEVPINKVLTYLIKGLESSQN